MNIFILDKDPIISAQLQCDKHVVKMILESAQMLSTAHRVLDGDEYANENSLYKIAHKNHPCSIWVRETISNYQWLYNHFDALGKEYTYRYNKIHKSIDKLLLPLKQPPWNISEGGLTEFALAMKHEPQCMYIGDPVKSYRTYYQTKRDNFNMVWTKRNQPEWFNANLHT